jgi:perosamine synthetase
LRQTGGAVDLAFPSLDESRARLLERAGLESVHWMYAVLVEGEFGLSRDELRAALAAEGIETRTFFVPLHLQPAYGELHRGQRFPVAERLAATGLYLPSSPSLDDDDVDRVAAAVRAACRPTRATA